jgi:lysophospholipase L1-like esterase
MVNAVPIPAGDYYITVNDPSIHFTVFKYISDTEGELIVTTRNASINYSCDTQSYITLSKVPLSNITPHDIHGAIAITNGKSLNERVTILEQESESSQKIVFLGDSIFGYERGSTSIPLLVGEYLGAKTYNCALGGTEGNSHGDAKWAYYDFTELSKAIASGNFTNQQAHTSDSGVPSYFSGVIAQLASLDFSNIDLICLTYGGNDYTNSRGNISEFVNAMCTNINRILAAFPNIRFMIMTPPYKRFLDPTTHEFINDGDTKQNANGLTLKDFADSFSTISENIHVPYINAYDELGINRYNSNQWFITNDNSHPSLTGRKETAKLVSQYIKRMIYD